MAKEKPAFNVVLALSPFSILFVLFVVSNGELHGSRDRR